MRGEQTLDVLTDLGVRAGGVQIGGAAPGRRLVEGDRYARGPNFLRYDPSFMLGREVHGATLGIIGMGGIGEQVARRARAFDMTVLYCNRRRKPDAEAALGARHVAVDRAAGHHGGVDHGHDGLRTGAARALRPPLL